MTATRTHNPATPPADPEHALWASLHTAARTPNVSNAIRRLYDQLDDQVRRRGPVCRSSGRCCHFEQYGHRLYVTALEIAWVLAQQQVTLDGSLPPPDTGRRVRLEQVTQHGSCPFQADRLCSVHTIRPMGCRVFFCQQGTERWQNELYETFLARLRRLHEDMALTYRYVEWRTGLRDAMHNRPQPPLF